MRTGKANHALKLNFNVMMTELFNSTDSLIEKNNQTLAELEDYAEQLELYSLSISLSFTCEWKASSELSYLTTRKTGQMQYQSIAECHQSVQFQIKDLKRKLTTMILCNV